MNQGQPQDKAHGEQDYLAFISYRHADNSEEDQQWATWLHQQLEVYDVPDDLIGTPNLRGEIVPERIYPVFRDEVSLPADADLSHAISQALDQSRFLIVLCSPRVVQSRYVNEEILHFKSSGKQDRIMAALILGEPNASIDPHKTQDPEHANTLECFPPALQYHVTADGQLDKSKPTEPIAANFRLPDGGKGLTNPNVYKQHLLKKGRNKKDADRLAHLYEEQVNNARLKIIAGILGVPLERLTQRDKIHQLNKARAATQKFRRIAVGMGTLALATLIVGGIATVQWRRSEQLLGELRGNLHFINFELWDIVSNYLPDHEKINILKHFDSIIGTLQLHGGQTAEEQRQIAIALGLKADAILDNIQLDPNGALPLYQQALGIFEKLGKQDPNNIALLYDSSLTHNKIGDLRQLLGQTTAALEDYQLSFAIIQILNQRVPSETNFKRQLSICYNRIGDLHARMGNNDDALKLYKDSLVIVETLSKNEPNNFVFQLDISITHNKIGDLQMRSGNTDSALKSFLESLLIVNSLNVREGGGNIKVLRVFSITNYKLFRAYKINNDVTNAKHYLLFALNLYNQMFVRGVLAPGEDSLMEQMEDELKSLSKNS